MKWRCIGRIALATFIAFALAALLPLAGCFDGTLAPLIRAIEWPEIEHQKQLRAKLPKPKPLIDPYRTPTTQPLVPIETPHNGTHWINHDH